MTQHRTIEDFGLQRTDEEPLRSIDSLEFLVPFSGPTGKEREWHVRRVIDARLPARLGELFKYAYNSLKRAFVVLEVFLEDGEGERITQMRMWQMFLDSWTASGNSSDSVRYVSFSNIINPTVRELIEEEWEYQEFQSQSGGQGEYGTLDQRILTVTPGNSTTWDRNPFIRSGVRIATSLSTAGKTVTCEKAHLIKRYGNGMYMVLEFKNGDLGQENYRERLIRRLKPMVSHNLEHKQATRTAGREWEHIVFLPPQMYPGRNGVLLEK